MLRYLNENAGAIQVITTVFLAIFTAIYVFLTGRLVYVTRLEHDADIRPYVLVRPYLRSDIMVSLLIKNVGKTAAENVTLTLDQDFFQFGDASRNLRNMPLFSKPISSIMPGVEYHVDLGTGPTFFQKHVKEPTKKMPNVFSVTSSYSYFSKAIFETAIIDVSAYYDTHQQKSEISDEIEDLRKAVERGFASVETSIKRMQ